MKTTLPFLTLCATHLAACSLIVDPDINRLYPPSGIDGSRPDGGGLRPDGDVPPPADGGIPDDGATPTDAGVDPGLDAGPPPVGPGCLDGSDEQRYDSGRMVGCDGMATQCAAGTLCAPGWHLCRYTEYAAHGGALEPTATSRWLAGCVRRGCSLDPMPAEDGICGDCASGEAMLPIPVAYPCSGARPLEAIGCDIGATSSFQQHRLGSIREECLYAEPTVTRTRLGAMCCR